eukprot:TRINITY_DN1788_c3_g1_i2.p2 TRINITY_DN1788_c3_g1~~TRINITY_DN1788_c3_g1_i2.p2  ORF type:complete len:362 (+),score=85.50 TRINITY_DN1788_c3_g1_i2:121-1206(+)
MPAPLGESSRNQRPARQPKKHQMRQVSSTNHGSGDAHYSATQPSPPSTSTNSPRKDVQQQCATDHNGQQWTVPRRLFSGEGDSEYGSAQNQSQNNQNQNQSDRDCVIDSRKYKTKLCRNWSSAVTCPYGDRCVFAHGGEDLRRMEDPNPFESVFGNQNSTRRRQSGGKTRSNGSQSRNSGSASSQSQQAAPVPPPPPPPPHAVAPQHVPAGPVAGAGYVQPLTLAEFVSANGLDERMQQSLERMPPDQLQVVIDTLGVISGARNPNAIVTATMRKVLDGEPTGARTGRPAGGAAVNHDQIAAFVHSNGLDQQAEKALREAPQAAAVVIAQLGIIEHARNPNAIVLAALRRATGTRPGYHPY